MQLYFWHEDVAKRLTGKRDKGVRAEFSLLKIIAGNRSES